jgi:hypothetical protein
MFRLTRREQVLILGLCLALFVGAIVQHFRAAGKVPAQVESK